MTFQNLYLGQRVRILSWDELNHTGHHDNAYGIRLPDNSFFNNGMKYLCGATLTIVKEPSYSDSDEDYLSPDIFQFDDPLLSLLILFSKVVTSFDPRNNRSFLPHHPS